MRKALLFLIAVFMLSSYATKQNPQEEKVKASYATYNSLDASINNAIAQVQQEHKNNEIVREEELEPLFEKSQKLYRAVKFYKNNQPTGTWQWFDESNNLVKEANYENGELHGWWRTYDDKTGRVIWEIPYKYGIKHGVEKFYDIVNGKRFLHLLYETRWESGEAVIRKFYKKGKIWQKHEVKISDGGIKTLIVQTYSLENGKVIEKARHFIK